MSTVMRVPWTNRLTKMIQEPGGVRVGDALEAAQTNLDSIRDSCLQSIDARLEELEQLHQQTRAGDASELRDEIYSRAADIHSVAGVFGLAELGQAAFSLCDLVDRLRSLGRWDQQAVAVHLNALRLFRNPQPGTAAAVLEGLQRVTNRLPKPATAEPA